MQQWNYRKKHNFWRISLIQSAQCTDPSLCTGIIHLFAPLYCALLCTVLCPVPVIVHYCTVLYPVLFTVPCPVLCTVLCPSLSTIALCTVLFSGIIERSAICGGSACFNRAESGCNPHQSFPTKPTIEKISVLILISRILL